MSLITPLHFRSLFQAKIGDHLVAVSDSADVTLLIGRAKHSIFVQLIVVDVTTSDLVKWTFQDEAPTPLIVGSLGPGPGVGQFVVVDYGPQGRPITEGKNLVLTFTGDGMAGNVHVDAYLKQTSAMSAAELASG